MMTEAFGSFEASNGDTDMRAPLRSWRFRLRYSWLVGLLILCAVVFASFIALRGVTMLQAPTPDYGQHLIRHMRYAYAELASVNSLLKALNAQSLNTPVKGLISDATDHLHVRIEVLTSLRSGPFTNPVSKATLLSNRLMEGLDGLRADGQAIDQAALESLRTTSGELLNEIGDYTRQVETNVDQMLHANEEITSGVWLEVTGSITLLLILSVTALGLFMGNRRIVRQLRRANDHDALTGLVNRRGFTDAISRRSKARNPSPHALIMVNLDHFKQINDQHGHHHGDGVIKAAAKYLIDTFGEHEIIARWGGDEFVVAVRLPKGAYNKNHLSDIKQKLTSLMSIQPSIKLNGQRAPIDFSCGIALWPKDGLTVNQVMIRADAALHEAKASGRSRFVFYHEGITERQKEEEDIKANLGRALSNGQFFLEFQPQYCFSSKSYVGAEALLRWRCSITDKIIPPAKFIPIAEKSGQIWAIDKFVLDEACRTAADWARSGFGQKRVAVNLSPHSFQRLGLGEVILSALERWKLSADTLEIEITEGVQLTDSPQVETNLADIAKLGVRIALDDFGTGYSNIAYLAKLKPDLLKIDRSFLKETNPHTRVSIVKGIERLASTLGAETLVEGIETPDELQFVQNAGCQLVQGFLLARPMPANKIANFWLENQTAE